MKSFLIPIMLLCNSLFALAQSRQDILAYINKYAPLALEQERKYHIPASITLAQGIVESGAGKSKLTQKTHNHFGVKALGKWNGPVYHAWDDEPQQSKFRVYPSDAASFEDHSLFLCRDNIKRYRRLFSISPFDYRGWAQGLKDCGYATAPHYAKALIGYIENFKLYAINGGRKLKPMVPITITTTVNQQPVFAPDCVIEEYVETEEQLSVENTLERYLVVNNGVRCTILYPGEDIDHIANRYDMVKSDLLRLNDTSTESIIQDGEIIYLQKKKSKYDGPKDFHYVKNKESLHHVSQEYGIRLASLAKMNKQVSSLYTPLKEGERIRLK